MPFSECFVANSNKEAGGHEVQQNSESQVVKCAVEGAGFPMEGTDGPGEFDKTGQCSFDSPARGIARTWRTGTV